jgi:hypothetical protein
LTTLTNSIPGISLIQIKISEIDTKVAWRYFDMCQASHLPSSLQRRTATVKEYWEEHAETEEMIEKKQEECCKEFQNKRREGGGGYGKDNKNRKMI